MATIKEIMELYDSLTAGKSREAAAIYSEQMANGWDAGYEAGYRAGLERAGSAQAEKKEA
ncbi:MAG: hypothetical protein IJ381_08355 [Clostridia bacterium]|nr:hypothetical protein [Clostridia bacterium]